LPALRGELMFWKRTNTTIIFDFRCPKCGIVASHLSVDSLRPLTICFCEVIYNLRWYIQLRMTKAASGLEITDRGTHNPGMYNSKPIINNNLSLCVYIYIYIYIFNALVVGLGTFRRAGTSEVPSLGLQPLSLKKPALPLAFRLQTWSPARGLAPQLRSRSSFSHVAGSGSFGTFGHVGASEALKNIAIWIPEPLCVRHEKLFTAPELLFARKECYLFIGVPKHQLFVALEPNPLFEVAFETTIRSRIPVSPNSGPFHSAPLECMWCTGSDYKSNQI